MDGEVIKADFYLIKDNPAVAPTLDIPATALRECCSAYSFKALADTNSTDEFKNDVSIFDWFFGESIDDAAMVLLRYQNGTYEEVDTLANDDYGTYHAFGSFINDSGENYVGYTIEWKEVIEAFGIGSYKVQITTTDVFANEVEILSRETCLQQYNADRANGTVKIEYYINGIIGDNSNDEKTKDFGTLNRYNSIRVPGFFGYPGSEYERDYVEYESGQRNYVEDEQEPEYTMKLKPVAAFIHDIMRTDILQADKILITDYNTNNADTYIQKKVVPNSAYQPNWKPLKNKLAGVELKFRQEFNNFKKLRS